jgi:heme O synthase-like polyprenyltransferase
MAESKSPDELKSYADGWINERKGTDVPTFLKFAYLVIAAAVLVYFFVYMNGEVHNVERGMIVQQFNRVTQSSPGFMYTVAALMAVFIVVLVKFVFSKFHED